MFNSPQVYTAITPTAYLISAGGEMIFQGLLHAPLLQQTFVIEDLTLTELTDVNVLLLYGLKGRVDL